MEEPTFIAVTSPVRESTFVKVGPLPPLDTVSASVKTPLLFMNDCIVPLTVASVFSFVALK